MAYSNASLVPLLAVSIDSLCIYRQSSCRDVKKAKFLTGVKLFPVTLSGRTDGRMDTHTHNCKLSIMMMMMMMIRALIQSLIGASTVYNTVYCKVVRVHVHAS